MLTRELILQYRSAMKTRKDFLPKKEEGKNAISTEE